MVDTNTGYVSIEVTIESRSFLALIDTGAGVSLISRDVVDRIGERRITPTHKVIRNASGQVMLTSGQCKLTLKIGEKLYTHDFIVSENKALPSPIILGVDFMRRFNMNLYTKPLQLYIEGEEIVIAKMPMKHAILVTDEMETELEMNDSKDNPRYKCSVAEASILQSERVSYVTLETSLVESNTAIFEPVPGVIGAQFLCPGLVRLENDKDKRKSRFVIRYINFSREHIQIDPGKILGYVQACERETLPMENDKT